MDPFSLATGALGAASVAAEVVAGCTKLYQYWKSVQEAPIEVDAIISDLKLLETILIQLCGDTNEKSPAVATALAAVSAKVNKLLEMMGEFDDYFVSGNATSMTKVRPWKALRVSSRMAKVKMFKESLKDTKSTLMLGLIFDSIERSKVVSCQSNIPVAQTARPMELEDYITSLSPQDSSEPPPPPYAQEQRQEATEKSSTLSAGSVNKVAEMVMKKSMHLAMEKLLASGTIEQLMSNTITQVTQFDSNSAGSYEGGDCKMYHNKMPYRPSHVSSQRPRGGGASARLKPSRASHQTSSTGVLLGNIWIRTTTVELEDGSTSDNGTVDVTTSFIFYPSYWMTRMGFSYGAEASLNQSSTGWQFVWNPVRAVPEQSPIFDLCRQGNVPAVQLMLQHGHASVKDTSPKGWNPLHFAAAEGHIDLCSMLIDAGADKSALVYKGPKNDTLSPITIFAEMAQTLPASEKIRMMHLFEECIDLTSPGSDGWTVIGSLVASIGKENVPVSQACVNYVLRVTSGEHYVEFGPNTAWHGLQHAMRTFLSRPQTDIISRLLERRDNSANSANSANSGHQTRHHHLNERQITAVAYWLAVRGCQRELIPMIIECGRFMKIPGFDWFPDHLTPREYIRTLPVIYTTWAKALPNWAEQVDELVRLELEAILDKVQCAQDVAAHEHNTGNPLEMQCYRCGDDYTSLGLGLVQPRAIEFLDCTKTGHKVHCRCWEVLHHDDPHGIPLSLSVPTTSASASTAAEEAAEEELPPTPAAQSDLLDELCRKYCNIRLNGPDVGAEATTAAKLDPFRDAATLLFRAQGRRWLGDYKPPEMLCSTCFLMGEKYIGPDGLTADTTVTPIPDYYRIFSGGQPARAPDGKGC